jgi:hypothetical protein
VNAPFNCLKIKMAPTYEYMVECDVGTRVTSNDSKRLVQQSQFAAGGSVALNHERKRVCDSTGIKE